MYSVRIHIIEMLIFSPNVETNCHCNVEIKCHQISPIYQRNHFQVWRKIRIFVITTFGDKTLRTFLLLSIFVHHETKSLLLKRCGRDFKHLWTLLTALQGHYIVIVLHDNCWKAIALSRFVWLLSTLCCQMSLESIDKKALQGYYIVPMSQLRQSVLRRDVRRKSLHVTTYWEKPLENKSWKRTFLQFYSETHLQTCPDSCLALFCIVQNLKSAFKFGLKFWSLFKF